jgi:4-hydroxybenzoate polyprenyltransferase
MGLIYFAFVYNLVMYGINDVYDYESDIKNPRKTGIDGSVLPKTKHPDLWFKMLAISIPFTLYLLISGDLSASTWLVLMIFMVFAYSVKGLRLKEVPLLDSFTSSFHYTSPFIYGALLAGNTNLYLPAFITFFVWVMANHAFGAIQDIVPDKSASIRSVATQLGSQKTIYFVLSLYSIAAVLPVLFYGNNGAFVSLLFLPYVYIVARTLPDRANSNSQLFKKGWNQFLYINYGIGFVLTVLLLFKFNIVEL